MKKGVIVALSVALALVLIFTVPALWLRATFGGFFEKTEIDRVHSPYDSRYAQIVETDNGALGGHTCVDVVEPPVKILFFSVGGYTQRVYVGRSGEAKTIQVYWKDADTLLINGREYPAS